MTGLIMVQYLGLLIEYKSLNYECYALYGLGWLWAFDLLHTDLGEVIKNYERFLMEEVAFGVIRVV